MNSSVYVAKAGEKILPLKLDAEYLLVKNGVILTPNEDFFRNAVDKVELTEATVEGDQFYLINVSTFTFNGMPTNEDMSIQNTKISRLETKVDTAIKKGQWYTSVTPQFKARFEAINGWVMGGEECMFKETDYELRLKGIIRRSNPSTEVGIIKVKNTSDMLINGYDAFVCNIPADAATPAGSFSSYYFEPFNATNGDGVITCNAVGITDWIMLDITIAKNPNRN